MTQQSISVRNVALEKAWGNIIFDHWDQMAWLVKLANTDMATLTDGDFLNWQDQCEAIRMVPISFSPVPSDRKRYPFHGGGAGRSSPTRRDLENIHAAIAPRLNNIADGVEVSFGSIQVIHKTRFRKSTEAEQQAGYPRYLIYPYDHVIPLSQLWPNEFLFRAEQLVKEYVDGIRRCPHCKKVFLQLRQNATYCGRACHSVAGMQRLRAQQALEKNVKTHGRGTISKGRSPHGKKRR